MRRALVIAAALMAAGACSSGATHVITAPGPPTSTAAAHPTAAPPTKTGTLTIAPPPSSSPCTDSPAHPLGSIQMLNASTGWVAARAGLYRTTDGGAHWILHRIASPHGIGDVDFIDAQHGWATGPKSLFRTTDGGVTWTRLSTGCDSFVSVHFVSPTLGYAIRGDEEPPWRGGVAVVTGDGGETWNPFASAPSDAQSICMANDRQGYLGAHGGIYWTFNGGAEWLMVVKRNPRFDPPFAQVQCAGGTAGWAQVIGPGAASNQQPQIGWRLNADHPTALFAEGYFPHPEVQVTTESPGGYPGPFSAIDGTRAAFVGACPVCGGYGTTELAFVDGASLGGRVTVPDMTTPLGAAFVTRATGWITGRRQQPATSGSPAEVPSSITRTTDGGHTWLVQLVVPFA